MRRLLPVVILCAVMLAHGGRAALAQVQLVIPFPAGGGSDIIGRLIQPVLAETLGQQLLIRNVGGAAGTIGTAEVAPWRAAEIHITRAGGGTSYRACTGANTRTYRRACGGAAGGTIGFARAAGCDSQDHGSRADQCTRFRRISGFRS